MKYYYMNYIRLVPYNDLMIFKDVRTDGRTYYYILYIYIASTCIFNFRFLILFIENKHINVIAFSSLCSVYHLYVTELSVDYTRNMQILSDKNTSSFCLPFALKKTPINVWYVLRTCIHQSLRRPILTNKVWNIYERISTFIWLLWVIRYVLINFTYQLDVLLTHFSKYINIIAQHNLDTICHHALDHFIYLFFLENAPNFPFF
jgi:hypothetical protein